MPGGGIAILELFERMFDNSVHGYAAAHCFVQHCLV